MIAEDNHLESIHQDGQDEHDVVETNNYVGTGINETIFKPIDWIKQKNDKYIKGDIVYKTRDSLEPFIYPTSKIIGLKTLYYQKLSLAYK